MRAIQQQEFGGPEVLRLKQRFYELGYFRANDFTDVFQQSTADTVRRFEKQHIERLRNLLASK